ncbi:complex I subunit 4 family protein [Methylobacter luteus]|uniref:complex I subunit 4 family protein n=1 Tax=Methylobacter luteus TaxID=415 RepID=UPI000421B6CB|nr:NADH-quinone oxidoreductase subunit M [Methylobacter luteus]
MSETGFPLLSLVMALPLLGALATGTANDSNLAKKIALSAAGLELVATLFVVYLFNADDSGFQLIERHTWLPSLNIEYLVGIDGISVLFLPMSALLTLVAIAASWNSVQYLPRFHFALLLALEGVTMGVFVALDMVLFFLFWELTLPPIFFLIGLWGIGPQRRGAAMKYTLFMLFGGVPLLFAIIMLAVNHAAQMHGSVPQNLIFSLPILLDTPIPGNWQTIIFLLLLTGFAVKAPLVPFHTWLPTTAMEAPAHMTALLTGLKLGAFGLLRYTMPLTPAASVEYAWVLGILGAITLVYGAMIALQQTNLRRLLAYASVSHVGLVIVGIATLNMQGIQGAVFQLLNFTLIASCLMLIAGFIQHRLGTTEVIHLGGLAKVMPRLTAFFFLFAIASIGVPGASGFPAELLLIIGALNAHPSLGIAALMGAILGASYMLSFIRRAFYGPVVHVSVSQLQDLRKRELGLLCVPALLVLLFGFFPNLILNTNKSTAEAWLSRLTSSSFNINDDYILQNQEPHKTALISGPMK